MCTAAAYKTKDFYFGRTLDYEFSFGDQVTITPRNYPFRFRFQGTMETHYAMIGMAHVADDYPLYYEAVMKKAWEWRGLISLEMPTMEKRRTERIMWPSLNLFPGSWDSALL